MTGYKIPDRFSTKDKRAIHKTIIQDLNKGMTARQIKNDLRSKGLGYRDTNLYHDIRRKQASYIKTKDSKGNVRYKAMGKEAREKSQKWFDNVFEKYRQERKVSSKQASKTWSQAKDLTKKQLRQARYEQEAEIWEYYKII